MKTEVDIRSKILELLELQKFSLEELVKMSPVEIPDDVQKSLLEKHRYMNAGMLIALYWVLNFDASEIIQNLLAGKEIPEGLDPFQALQQKSDNS